MKNKKQQKSIFWAYFLWMTGGFFGLHQIYLGRDNHAITIWMSMGGCLGIGLIRDLWKMPSYLANVNQDPDRVAYLNRRMSSRKEPGFGFTRFVSAIVVSNILGHLIHNLVKDELSKAMYKGEYKDVGTLHSFIILAVITGKLYHFFFDEDIHDITLLYYFSLIGVYIVGNIGTLKGTFSENREIIEGPFAVSTILYLIKFQAHTSIFITSLLSICFFHMFLTWNRDIIPYIPTFCRILKLALFAFFIHILWLSWLDSEWKIMDENYGLIDMLEKLYNIYLLCDNHIIAIWIGGCLVISLIIDLGFYLIQQKKSPSKPDFGFTGFSSAIIVSSILGYSANNTILLCLFEDKNIPIALILRSIFVPSAIAEGEFFCNFFLDENIHHTT